MRRVRQIQHSHCVECGELLPDPLAGTTRLWGAQFGLCSKCLFIDPRKDEDEPKEVCVSILE